MELPIIFFETLFEGGQKSRFMSPTRSLVYNLVSLVADDFVRMRTNRELRLWSEQNSQLLSLAETEQSQLKRYDRKGLEEFLQIATVRALVTKLDRLVGPRKPYVSPWDVKRFLSTEDPLAVYFRRYGSTDYSYQGESARSDTKTLLRCELCTSGGEEGKVSSTTQCSEEYAYGVVLGSQYRESVSPHFPLRAREGELYLPLPDMTPLVYAEVLQYMRALYLMEESAKARGKGVLAHTDDFLVYPEKLTTLGFSTRDFREGYRDGRDSLPGTGDQ